MQPQTHSDLNPALHKLRLNVSKAKHLRKIKAEKFNLRSVISIKKQSTWQVLFQYSNGLEADRPAIAPRRGRTKGPRTKRPGDKLSPDKMARVRLGLVGCPAIPPRSIAPLHFRPINSAPVISAPINCAPVNCALYYLRGPSLPPARISLHKRRSDTFI